MPINAHIRRFGGEERGAVVIIFALLLVVLLGFVALGVDASSLYFRQKALQTRADLAAVSAVVNLDDGAPERAEATVTGNDSGTVMTGLSFATYKRDAALSPDDRLTPGTLGDMNVNAATVTLQEDAPLYFARTFLEQDTTRIGATATAARFDQASFTLGSRLASVHDGLLNALLSRATGSSIALNALDYRALADTQIDLLTFSDALAIRAGLTALTYEELLTSDIELVDIAGAILDTGLVQGSTAALDAILNSGSDATVNAAKLIAVENDNVAANLGDILPTIAVSAQSLLRASVDIINADHMIETGLNLGLPGLNLLDLKLIVGARPAGSGWITVGEKGATVHTAQVRLKLDLGLNIDLIDGLLGNVTAFELPIYLEVASATARLTALNCGAGEDEMLATFDAGIDPLDSSTGTHVAEIFLGKFDAPDFEDTSTPLDPAELDHGKLLGLEVLGPLTLLDVDVVIKAHAAVGVTKQGEVVFTRAELGQTKTLGSGGLLQSTVGTLVANADLDVRGGLLGSLLGAVLAPVLGALKPILAAVLAPVGAVDSLLDQILDLLGIGVGEADLTLQNVHCGRVMLVR